MTTGIELRASGLDSGGPTVPVLSCIDVVQEFNVRERGRFRMATVSAVAGVTFEVLRGETFAIVGETGSGKSTLARAILGAPPPRRGQILVNGHDVTRRRDSDVRDASQQVQMIFQDPFSALDPKWTVEQVVTEPLITRGEGRSVERRRKVAEILNRVGLGAAQFAGRLSYQLSGGQAQRVAIARALISAPDLVICDEPVTSLDVSIQAQILKLLADLRADLGLTYLLIAHDLAVVRVLADRTATMYLGAFCEIGPTASIFNHPAHPYTAALLSAIPPRPGEVAKRERIRLLGEPPSPLAPPSGCRFRTRCPRAQELCASVVPQMRSVENGHSVACHFPLRPVDAAS